MARNNKAVKNKIRNKNTGIQSSTGRWRYAAVLVVLCLIAVLIRTVKFGSIPGGMNQDGAMAAVDAAALAKYGTDRLGMRYPVHLTAWGFGQMSALLSYLMAPVVGLSGLSATTARIPSLLVSLAGLAALYGFARRVSADCFGKGFAVTVLFLGAINPWHILQSRWALDCNLFPHFLMFGLFFLLAGVKKKPLLVLSAVMFGLSMYCYGIALYTVPVFLLFAFIYLLCQKAVTVRQGILYAAVYLLISWPFFLCMIINFLGLETIETPLFTIPYFPYSMRSSDILFFSDRPLAQLWSNLRSVFRILSQTYNGLIWNEVPGFGTMYVFSIPFMIIGGVAMFRRFRRSTAAGLTCLLFLTGILNGLITANVNINRINLIFYPLILFCAAGIAVTVRFISKYTTGLRGFTEAGIASLFLVGFILFSRTYFTSYADEVSNAFMADFGEAVTAVKDLDAETYYITPDAQYEGYAHVSEVLTLFYHDIDAEYYQSDGFSQKYHFSNPSGGVPDSNAVYVTTEKYAGAFDGTDYILTRYGRFLTAVPAELA